MKYFKNTELAKLYNVSEKSVRNWIDAAESGKLEFELYEEKGKNYIANTSRNSLLVEQLVQKGKKYKNTRGFRTLTPSDAFYKTYTKKQILDIILNLTIHKEIPLQYGYLDGGADSWNHYANRLVEEEAPNVLKSTSDLLDLSAGYIDKLVGKGRKINIIDLGPGNGLPARATIERLLGEGRLNRYIAIDISPDMLDILKSNVETWFDGRVTPECYMRNFAEERFDDLLLEDRTKIGADAPINLVFLFGGTLSNLRYPDHTLRIINSSLGLDDLLFYSGYLDTPYTRRYFDLSGVAHTQKDPQQSGLIPSLLQMDESICDFEQFYSPEHHSRYKRMIPRVDIQIEFNIEGTDWPVELRKNEPILLWRHRHYGTIDFVKLFARNDFDLLQVTKSEDQQHILLVSRITAGTDA